MNQHDTNIVHLQVLLVGGKKFTMFGAPLVQGAKVLATVEQQTRGGKVIVFKKKRRKGYTRKHGESPYVTILRVDDIVV